MTYDLRFLVIGDFMFSLISFDLTDPAELIFKISRDSYLSKIELRASVNIEFGYD
jgi:hypothetical protein